MSEAAGGRPARIRVSRPCLPELSLYVEQLEGIWERGTLSNGGQCVIAFERAFARYAELQRATLALCNADIALTLALASLELPRGSRALLPSFGYPTSVHALEWNGLSPEFLDVDPHDWTLHAEQLEGRLDEDVSVVVATHMFGVPCAVEELEALTAASGAALVLDAAHAVATRSGERHIADFGDASVVSFSATKLATSAEGAIVTMRDSAAAKRLEVMRSYGMSRDGESELRGLNAKMSELHAALGLLAIEAIERHVERRRVLVELYTQALGSRPDVSLQRVPAGACASPSYFVVELGGARETVCRALAERGIESRPYFPALHLMPRLASRAHGELPVTERLSAGLLALPLYCELAASSVEEVCEIVCASLERFHSADGK